MKTPSILRPTFVHLTLAAVTCVSSNAAVLIGNLPADNDGGGTSISPTTFQKGVLFTLGQSAQRIDGVTLRLNGYDTVNDGTVAQVAFFLDDGSQTSPATQVGSNLAAPSSASTSPGDFSFNPSAAIILEANTTYWLLVKASSGTFVWTRPFPTSVAPTGTGASFNSYRISSDLGTTYSASTTFNSFQINATAIPEASTAIFSMCGLLALCVLNRSRK